MSGIGEDGAEGQRGVKDQEERNWEGSGGSMKLGRKTAYWGSEREFESSKKVEIILEGRC